MDFPTYTDPQINIPCKLAIHFNAVTSLHELMHVQFKDVESTKNNAIHSHPFAKKLSEHQFVVD